MSIRAARPGPRPGPPWPGHLRAVPGSAQLLSGPCRASPQAAPTAQARAHGPISCRAGPKSTPHSAVPCRPPPVSSPVRRCRVIRHRHTPLPRRPACWLLCLPPQPRPLAAVCAYPPHPPAAGAPSAPGPQPRLPPRICCSPGRICCSAKERGRCRGLRMRGDGGRMEGGDGSVRWWSGSRSAGKGAPERASRERLRHGAACRRRSLGGGTWRRG